MSTNFEQEVNEVVRLRTEEGKSFAYIASVMGFSESTAKRRFAAAVVTEQGVVEVIEEFPKIDKQHIPTFTQLPEDRKDIERFKPLVRTGDAIVSCDWHIPLHDPVMVNTLVECAVQNNIKKLIIGGDYYNMETFSSYLPYQPEASLQQERYDGAVIMRMLLSLFDEIDFIWGNHDFRLAKKLGFKYSFEDCMKWMLSDLEDHEIARIRFSELDYMYYYPSFQKLSDKGPKYRICHPRNFSSAPLTVGRKLAQKYNCSVITAHSHHCAIGAAPNGHDVVIEGGGFYHKNRTEYIQKSTTHHEWVQGFTMFKGGVPHLISPAFGNDKQYK